MSDWHYLDAESSYEYRLYPLSEFSDRLPSGEYRLFTDAELHERDVDLVLTAAAKFSRWAMLGGVKPEVDDIIAEVDR